MKKCSAFLLLFIIGYHATTFSANEKEPPKNKALELYEALHQKDLPPVTRNEVITATLLAVTTGVTARTVTCKMHPAISFVAITASTLGALSYSGARTELGRMVRVRRILPKEVLDAIAAGTPRLAGGSSAERHQEFLPPLCEAERILRPTHWMSKELIESIRGSIAS